MNKIIIGLFLCLLLFSSQAWASRIAILEPEDMNSSTAASGKDTVRKLLEDILSQGNTVLDRASVDKILTTKSMQFVGEITRQKAYLLGKILDVDILVVGNFIQHGDSVVINASFIDTGRTDLTGTKEKILDLFLSKYELMCQVKQVKGRDVTINMGNLSGLADGDMLNVFHNNDKIGMLQIAKAFPQECTTVLVKGKAVHLEDKVKKVPAVWGNTDREMIITSIPSPTRITINDREIGYTPLLFKNAETEMTIKLAKPDYQIYEEMLQFFNPDYSLLNLSLILISLQEKPKEVPISGGLLVTSEPSSAFVYVDGVLKGITPLLLADLAPQRYSLKVSKPGFAAKRKEIVVESGQQPKVAFYLRETIAPRKQTDPSLELLSIQTNNIVSPGECFLAAKYPELFVLKLGLPIEGMEIRMAGLGIGLKHRLIKDTSMDIYYNFYDARKKEKKAQQGVSLITGYPLKSRFFDGDSYLGGGYYSEKGYRVFGGIEIPIVVGVYNFMMEADTVEGWAAGFKEIFENGAEAAFGIGKDAKGKIRYDMTVSYRGRK